MEIISSRTYPHLTEMLDIAGGDSQRSQAFVIPDEYVALLPQLEKEAEGYNKLSKEIIVRSATGSQELNGIVSDYVNDAFEWSISE